MGNEAFASLHKLSFEESFSQSVKNLPDKVFEERPEDKRFAKLPVIGSVEENSRKYKPTNIIGYGAFGMIIGIRDVETKKYYALKFFCLQPQKDSPIFGDVSKKEQEEMIDSGLKEFKLLKEINNPNIITIEESFVINRSPLNDTKDVPFLCLVIEYCNGGNLNELIRKYEKRGEKIPKYYVLKWFIELMKTMGSLHDKNKIIHRDLKPDNLLFQLKDEKYYPTQRYTLPQIEHIKICDFGVGKVIGAGNFGRKIKGHVFFTAPEVLAPTNSVLKQSGYDSRCDVFSLGIIFFLMYKTMSQDSYEACVEKFFKKEKDEQKRVFLEGLKKKCEEKGETYKEPKFIPYHYLKLMLYVHKKGYIEKNIITKNIGDLGVRKMINSMICGYDKRRFCRQIIADKIFQTWDYILYETDTGKTLNDSELRDIVKNYDYRKISIAGLLTILKISEPQVFEKSLLILEHKILNSVSNNSKKMEFLNYFVKNRGIKIIFKTIKNFPEGGFTIRKKFMKQAVFLLMKFLRLISLQKNLKLVNDMNNGLLDSICENLREYDTIKVLKILFANSLINSNPKLKKDDNQIYIFCLICMYFNQTILVHFLDLAFKLLPKVHSLYEDEKKMNIFKISTGKFAASVSNSQMNRELLINQEDTLKAKFTLLDQNCKTVLFDMIFLIVSFLNSKETLRFLKNYRLDNIHIFKTIPYIHIEKDINNLLFNKIFDKLEFLITQKGQEEGTFDEYQNKKTVKKLLYLMTFFMFNFYKIIYQRIQPLAYIPSLLPSKDTKLKLMCFEDDRIEEKYLIIEKKISPRMFSYLGCLKNEDKFTFELLTDEPICKVIFETNYNNLIREKLDFEVENKKEFSIGYYEVLIKDGGINDRFIYGFEDEKERQILCDYVKGVLIFDNKEYPIGLELKCYTNVIVGIGITNTGRIFITYNNHLIKFFDIFDKNVDNNLHVFAVLKIPPKNRNLKGYINCGKRRYVFSFQNYRNSRGKHFIDQFSIQQIQRRIDLLIQLKSVYRDEKDLIQLCDTILHYKSFTFEKNDKLIKKYKKNKILKNIEDLTGIKHFEQLNHKFL